MGRHSASKKEELNFNAMYDLIASFESMPESAQAISRVMRLSLKKKIANTSTIAWHKMDSSGKLLDYDSAYHFVDIYRKLGLLSQILKNKKFLQLIENCYKKHKRFYASKKLMSPDDNKWSKILCIMSWTGILTKHDRVFWTGKIATIPYDLEKPIFPQCWNKIWALRLGFDINNVDEIKPKRGKTALLQKRMLVSYVPTLKDAFREDIFKEGFFVMLWKYRLIAGFLKIEIEREIKKVSEYFFLR